MLQKHVIAWEVAAAVLETFNGDQINTIKSTNRKTQSLYKGVLMMIIPVNTKSHTYEVHLGENILKDFCERNEDSFKKQIKLIVIYRRKCMGLHKEYFQDNFPFAF